MQVFSFTLISDLCPLERRSPVTTPSLLPSLPYPLDSLLLAGNEFRVTWSKRVTELN